ncbi:MAG: hypothetical protein OEV42_09205 [Deltaproteobacteria bacterium]|nr:hypothetical protein [Deltaproteobacteria bacterium]
MEQPELFSAAPFIIAPGNNRRGIEINGETPAAASPIDFFALS